MTANTYGEMDKEQQSLQSLQSVDLSSDATGSTSALSKADLLKSQRSVRKTVLTSLLVCSFYIIVSASMVFTNKSLTYTYKFNTTNVLLLMQMAFTAVLLRTARDVLKIIDFPEFERTVARQVAPVSVFYSLNAAVALVALRELSIPSYTLIKRLAPLFTLALEFLVLRKRPANLIVFGLLVMASGTVLAARADTRSSTFAWGLGFTSCLFQALYLTFVKRSGATTGLNTFGILYYHSILSLPCFCLIAGLAGEVPMVLSYEHWHDVWFIAVLTMSLGMGLLLNYALFLCTEKTSPTSTLVSGHVKALGQTIFGISAFGGIDLNAAYVVGTVLNAMGGGIYVMGKLQAIRQESLQLPKVSG